MNHWIPAKAIRSGYLAKETADGEPLRPGWSVHRGERLHIYLDTMASLSGSIRVSDVLGRQVAIIPDVSAHPQKTAGDKPWETGSGYDETVAWTVPELDSGVYFLCGKPQLFFTVTKRPEEIDGDILVLVSTNTFNAYSKTNKHSLYRHPVRANVVSFLRPQDQLKPEEWLPMLKWIRRSGTFRGRISYITDFEMETGAYLKRASMLIVLPHSEYWTMNARRALDAFVLNGGNAILASGNTMWWQVRIEGLHGDRLVCYKKDADNTDGTGDPVADPQLRTKNWRLVDPPYCAVRSIGGDFYFGGYGKVKRDKALGLGGLRILAHSHPLLEGAKARRGEYLRLDDAKEYDGCPVLGFDRWGHPIPDLERIGAYRFDLIAYEWCYRAGHTLGSTHLMRRTADSGWIFHLGAKDICYSFDKQKFRRSAQIIRLMIANAVKASQCRRDPFTKNIKKRTMRYALALPAKKIPKRLRATTSGAVHRNNKARKGRLVRKNRIELPVHPIGSNRPEKNAGMKVIIHVGYVKSASSSLQNLWFETAPASTCFVGKRPRRSGERFMAEDIDSILRNRIFEPHAADFNAAAARRVADRIQEIATSEGKDTILISYESLTGLSFAWYGIARAPFQMIADRLVNMWGGDIHFLTIIREQRSFLRSYHSQLVKQGYTASFTTFMAKSLGRYAAVPISAGPLPYLRYDEHQAVAKSVGASATWMPFEYLVSQGDALERIAMATGLSFNSGAQLPAVNKTKAPSLLNARLQRRRPEAVSKFDAREPAIAAWAEAQFRQAPDYARMGSRISDDDTAFLRSYFGQHNAALANSGYDLQRLGYLLPE
jgi:hypothetical protein